MIPLSIFHSIVFGSSVSIWKIILISESHISNWCMSPCHIELSYEQQWTLNSCRSSTQNICLLDSWLRNSVMITNITKLSLLLCQLNEFIYFVNNQGDISLLALFKTKQKIEKYFFKDFMPYFLQAIISNTNKIFRITKSVYNSSLGTELQSILLVSPKTAKTPTASKH